MTAELPRRFPSRWRMGHEGRVASIVLNYIHSDDALRCVASLSRSEYEDHHVIVVDNGSGDEALAQLRDGLDPMVELIALEDNLGYGGGNNAALRAAMDSGAEFCWVVNPDVVVEPSSLENIGEHCPSISRRGDRWLEDCPRGERALADLVRRWDDRLAGRRLDHPCAHGVARIGSPAGLGP